MIITAVILLAIGLAGRHFVERRRFNRRNAHGIEVFATYGQSVLVGIWERLLSFLAGLAFFGGAALLAVRLVTG